MTHIKTKIISLLVAFYVMLPLLQAQTTKSISVAHKTPYSDELSFQEGAKDMGLTMKILFDEDSNTLTVTLTSPKSLFVFCAAHIYTP